MDKFIFTDQTHFTKTSDGKYVILTDPNYRHKKISISSFNNNFLKLDDHELSDRCIFYKTFIEMLKNKKILINGTYKSSIYVNIIRENGVSYFDFINMNDVFKILYRNKIKLNIHDIKLMIKEKARVIEESKTYKFRILFFKRYLTWVNSILTDEEKLLLEII